MREVLVFGATKSAMKMFEKIKEDGNNILAFIDNDKKKVGGGYWMVSQ